MKTDVFRLLALCARSECDTACYGDISQAAAEIDEWDEVLAHVIDHRMAPLLYVHLRGAGVELPPDIRHELQSLYVRHRWADQILSRVMREVFAALDAEHIPALALKGAALSNMVYRESVLRPMSDLDILVPQSEIWRAGTVLANLGFNVPLPDDRTLHHRHLPVATRRSDGLTVAIELHHQLLSDYFDNVKAYARTVFGTVIGFGRRAEEVKRGMEESSRVTVQAVDWSWSGLETTTFSLKGLTVHTLSHEEMLRHVCLHLLSHVNVWDYARLIWMADLVSLAERYALEIDWEKVRKTTPAVVETLSLLHFSTPLSDELRRHALIQIGRKPRGIGQDYQGWPRVRGTQWRQYGFWQVLRQTLLPSEWWLRLRYARGSTRSLFWYRWVRHPLYICGHVVRSWLERLGWPSPMDLVRGRSI